MSHQIFGFNFLLSRLHIWVSLSLIMMLQACSVAPPKGLSVVTPFDIQRYEGTWYEIARLDHFFERDMIDVTAHYSAQENGTVTVLNRGFDTQKKEWKEAVGKAFFTGKTNQGSLKVSFFGPFYGGYHVIALDPDYQWSMIAGPDRSYLWILAREKNLAPSVREKLIQQARSFQFPTENLIWVPHRQ